MSKFPRLHVTIGEGDGKKTSKPKKRSSANKPVVKPAVSTEEMQREAWEEGRLKELEAVIERGLPVFIEVGKALAEIRDSRLYRWTHSTFEAYCRDRWKFSKTHSNRLIEAGKVAAELTPIGAVPATESQARELARVKDPEERREVWREVVATHKPEKITAGAIRRVVLVNREKKADPEKKESFQPRMVSDAEGFAHIAISQLSRIRDNDPKKFEALAEVEDWIRRKREEWGGPQ